MKIQLLKALLVGSALLGASAISFNAEAGCSHKGKVTCNADGCSVSYEIVCEF